MTASSRASLVLAFLGAIAPLGCAALKPPLTGPLDGGATWTELTSPHFVMDTDASADEARVALADFEGIEGLLEDVAFPASPGAAARPPPQRTQIVLFTRDADYQAFARRPHTAGWFDARPHQEVEARPRAILRGQLDVTTRALLQHELSHRHIRESLAQPPVWLNEGLAEYFSTARVEDGKAMLGEPPPRYGFANHLSARSRYRASGGALLLPLAAIPPVSVLTSLDAAHFYAGSEDLEAALDQTARYAGSWALVHMMMNGPVVWRERFGRYLEALHGGAPRDAAWKSGFDGVDPDEIERAFRAYLLRPDTNLRVTAYTPRPPAAAASARTLSDAEVHLVWAKLLPWDRTHAAAVERELARAAATAPDSTELRLTRAIRRMSEQHYDEALLDLSAAEAKAPADPRVLVASMAAALARFPAAGSGPSEVAALAGRLEPIAASSVAFELVARARLALNQPRAALGAAKRAVEADPQCYRCLDTLAIAADHVGEHAKAAELEARAIDLAPDTSNHATMRKRLERFRDAAAAPPPP